MAKMRVTKERVVALAVEIADAKGYDALSLKEIADRLNVSPQAMFNHVGSLQGLKSALAQYGNDALKNDLIKAAFGKSGIDALREMSRAYHNFAKSHPGVYKAIQRMNVWNDKENEDIILVVNLITQIAMEFGLSELEGSHLVRLLRSYLHGFADIVAHNGFGHESSAENSFEFGLEVILNGIKNKSRHN